MLAHFGLLEDREFLESGQCAAGIVLLKKTQKTIQIMQEWLEVFYKHFELIDDAHLRFQTSLNLERIATTKAYGVC